MSNFENHKILTAPEAAIALGVSQSWLYRHRRELPSFKIGRLVRFDSALLLRQFQAKYPARTENRLGPGKGEVMGLARYQRGTVYKCGKRIKVWYGQWREDVCRADGSFIRIHRNKRLGAMSELPTRAAAYEELSRRMGCGTPSVDMKFSEVVERWKSVVVPTIKSTTAAYYQKELRAHIIPWFGERKIASITRYDVEAFLADRARLYCRNTLRGMRVSLGLVLTWAIACGWLEKNPCAGVKLPWSGEKTIRTILKPEDVLAIVRKLEEPYATLVLFLAVTGLRVGEAIAIKWSDFDGDVLHVSRRIYEGQVDSPKTKSSNRNLPIPPALLSRMRTLGGSEWVFRATNGSPVNPGNALKRYIRPAVQALGIQIGGWHDFRHTFVTSLRKMGWSSKVIAGMVGHSNIQTTERIYDHADREDFRAAFGDLASELFPNSPKLYRDVAKSVTVN
jgi:integrase